MTRPHTHSGGFTLIELMLTVMVAAVLLGIGVPAFTDVIRNNRLAAASNDLLRSSQLARSEAIKRQVPVVVCASSNANADPPACNYGDFTQWIVFADLNNNWRVDAAEPVVERHGALPAAVSVRNDNDGIISYAASGFSNLAGVKTPSSRVVICDSRGNAQVGTNSTARALFIEATGRTRVTKNYAEVGSALAVAGSCPR